MALPDAIENYVGMLRLLLRESDSVVVRGRLMREFSPQSAAERPEEALIRGGFSVAEAQQPFSRLAVAAEDYLEVADALQRELERESIESSAAQRETTGTSADERETIESSADERLAALMSGHWLAATGLTLAAESSLEMTRPPGIDSLRRVLAIQLPESGDLSGAIGGSEYPAAEVVLSYAQGQELAEIEAGLRGLPPVRGAAVDPADSASARIMRGLVLSTNSIAANVAASNVLGPLLNSAVSSFVRGGSGYFASGTQLGIGRIRKAALKVIQRATEIARKFLGNEPVDQVEDWIRTNVMELVVQTELKFVRKALKADELEKASQRVLAALTPAGTKDRIAKLDLVAADYQRWSKWATSGSRLLAMVPTVALGPAGPPVVAAAAVALLAYQVWTTWDHLDWPRWPLPSRALGIAAVLGVRAP